MDLQGRGHSEVRVARAAWAGRTVRWAEPVWSQFAGSLPDPTVEEWHLMIFRTILAAFRIKKGKLPQVMAFPAFNRSGDDPRLLVWLPRFFSAHCRFLAA
jgi:hypothetical protein